MDQTFDIFYLYIFGIVFSNFIAIIEFYLEQLARFITIHIKIKTIMINLTKYLVKMIK